jgi:hypothetical protein
MTMGWKSASVAAVFSIATILASATQPAQATSIRWLMCWVPGDASGTGASDCVKLPSNWYIPGVRKAYCDSYYRCGRSQVIFEINRRNLRSVARYAPVDRSDLGVVVSIYSGVYR